MRYCKIEKIPGPELSDCCFVLDSAMSNQDVAHPKMRRRIENSKILLLDCPLEYKKGVWGVLGLFCRGVVRKCVGGIDKKGGSLLLR